MITIIDYGLGNLGSVYNMLRKLGFNAEITSDIEKIENATKIILPGVGTFDSGINQLHKSGISDSLNKAVLDNSVPILGICLGMQIMSRGSEEGELPGLGWMDAYFRKFPSVSTTGQQLRIPNIGWNFVDITNNNELTDPLPEKPRFYFVHSYFPVLEDPGQSIMECTYNGFPYVCAYRKNNIWGVQYHPEKSHVFGMQLLKNFASSI
jgi:imidazole glycerol-phosphate synthase subunit HisH